MDDARFADHGDGHDHASLDTPEEHRVGIVDVIDPHHPGGVVGCDREMGEIVLVSRLGESTWFTTQDGLPQHRLEWAAPSSLGLSLGLGLGGSSFRLLRLRYRQCPRLVRGLRTFRPHRDRVGPIVHRDRHGDCDRYRRPYCCILHGPCLPEPGDVAKRGDGNDFLPTGGT